MEGYAPRKEPAYPGELTDENIRAIFDGAGDFIARQLLRLLNRKTELS